MGRIFDVGDEVAGGVGLVGVELGVDLNEGLIIEIDLHLAAIGLAPIKDLKARGGLERALLAVADREVRFGVGGGVSHPHETKGFKRGPTQAILVLPLTYLIEVGVALAIIFNRLSGPNNAPTSVSEASLHLSAQAAGPEVCGGVGVSELRDQRAAAGVAGFGELQGLKEGAKGYTAWVFNRGRSIRIDGGALFVESGALAAGQRPGVNARATGFAALAWGGLGLGFWRCFGFALRG